MGQVDKEPSDSNILAIESEFSKDDAGHYKKFHIEIIDNCKVL